MIVLKTLFWLILFINLALADSLTSAQKLKPTELTLIGQPGWSPTINYTYYIDGSAYARLQGSTSILSGTLPITNVAGSYVLWMRLTAVNGSGGKVGVQIGDGTGTITAQNGLFTNTLAITTSIPFTNISIVCTNTLSLTDYYISSIYLTTNSYEANLNSSSVANTRTYWAKFGPLPTTTNTADIVKGNLIKNSSFEFAFNDGWYFPRSPGYNTVTSSEFVTWLYEGIDTTTSNSGNFSAKISQTAALYQLQSPPIRVRPGDYYRKYTLSFYAKGNGPTLTGNIYPVVSSVTGYSYPNISFTIGVPGASWTRYSTNVYLTALPSPEYYITLQHVSTGTGAIWIDDLQFEEGDVSAYGLTENVELGLISPKIGNSFFVGETPYLYMVSDNRGSAIPYIANMTIYGINNEIITNRVFHNLAPAGITTNVIYLPTDINAYRVVLQKEKSNFASEINYLVMPYEIDTTGILYTNSLFGTHANASLSAIKSNQLWGLSWTRTLSPANTFTWRFIEASEGVYTWSSADANVNAMSNNVIVFGSFGDMNGQPTWAYTNSFPRLDRLEMYVSNVVNRYKSSVKYWELNNEPQYTKTTNQIADMTVAMVRGITNADPTAIIYYGGGQTSTNTAANVWYLLDSGTKSAIRGLTDHLYPDAGLDWNADEYTGVMKDFYNTATAFGLEIWNSETGSWKFAHKHLAGGWLTEGTYFYTNTFYEIYGRSHWQSTERMMRNALRSVGWYHKYFQYYSRLVDFGYQRQDTHPSLLETDDAIAPDGMAYFYANYLIGRGRSLGQITNTTASDNIESYAFIGSRGESVVAAFTKKLSTNLVLAVTNTSFSIKSMFGQPKSFLYTSNVVVGRCPIYLVSTVLTTNQLIQTFTNATMYGTNDFTAPRVSIDFTPTGEISSNNVPLLFKWLAVDDMQVNTELYPTVVLTRYKIENYDSDWSSWNNEGLRIINTLLPNGTYRFQVQAKDEYGNTSSTISGPYFYIGTIPSKIVNSTTVENLIVPE